MFVEGLTAQSCWLVPHVNGLQRNRCDSLPQRRSVHLRSKPLRVADVSAKPCLQSTDTLLAYEEPQLERSEPASQGDTPIPEVLDLRVSRRPQIAGIGGHHANQ